MERNFSTRVGNTNSKKNVSTTSNTRQNGGIRFESKELFGHRDVLPILIGNACAMTSATSKGKDDVENGVVALGP